MPRMVLDNLTDASDNWTMTNKVTANISVGQTLLSKNDSYRIQTPRSISRRSQIVAALLNMLNKIVAALDN